MICCTDCVAIVIRSPHERREMPRSARHQLPVPGVSSAPVNMAPFVDIDALRKQMGFMCVLACAVVVRRRGKPCRRVDRTWVRSWIERRGNQGAFSLVGELCLEDPCSFRNYLRMTQGHFEELCGLVAPSIKRQDTNMRLAISVAQRVALILRFLATGMSSNYIDHTPPPYTFHVPPCSANACILKKVVKNRHSPNLGRRVRGGVGTGKAAVKSPGWGGAYTNYAYWF